MNCLVCGSLSAVFCTADAAFLCLACDKTIHSANVISRGHKRLPVCELCKRSAATVYCHEDAACLCAGCDAEVHSANPLPHNVVPIEHAMVAGIVKCAGLPFALPASAVPAPAPAAHAGQLQRAADDEVSACGGAPADPGSQLVHSPSDGNTASLAVVPDVMMPSMLPTGAEAGASSSKPAWAAKDDLDLLDFEAAWLGNLDMGMDLADFLGHDSTLDVPGMVPTLPAPEDVPAPQQQVATMPQPDKAQLNNNPFPGLHAHDDLDAMVHQHDDFVVPSFLPDDLSDDDLAAPPVVTAHAESDLLTKKRSADTAFGNTNTNTCAQYPVMLAPPPPPPSTNASFQMGSALVPAPPTTRAAAQHASSGAGVSIPNSANLTREQRVARYREKRKNRTFQKTIRYASRKAYAEVRPRIKGRFATKEEVEAWKAAQAAGLVGPNEEFRLL